MASLVALLDHEAAAAIRRVLPPGAPALVRAASATALVRLLQRRPIEGIITAAGRMEPTMLGALRDAWPTLPVVVTVAPRADDGPVLRRWQQAGATALVVAGVDDAIAGLVLLRHAYVTARWRAFAAVRRLARCETPLQAAVWHRLLAEADAPPPTAILALDHRLARETLSRQFGAGDAPTLKRAADAARVAFAAQLLANPACPVPRAAALLGYAGAAHLRTAARRIAGVAATELAALGPAGVLSAFLRGRSRADAGET